jgi:PilZ domain
MIERRQNQRVQRDLEVQVSGRDAKGTAFAQSVNASDISKGGALLSGLSWKVRTGDLVWVEYEGRKARFRIVWVRDSHSGLKFQAAVHRLEKEECPWSTSSSYSIAEKYPG